MSQLLRVIEALYCDPWCVRADFLPRLCRIVDEHATGLAHEAGGCAVEFAATPENPERGLRMAVQPATVGGKAQPQKIAVIDVNGVVGRKFSNVLNSSGVVSIDVLESIVNNAAADPSVAAVVLDFESPGGHSIGVGDAAETIARATATKPVVAYSGGQMCSAAYWLAAPADAIVVGATSCIGSIGVYTVFMDMTRAYKNAGIEVELIKAGRLKGIGVDGTKLSDEGRAFLQERVAKVYEQFTGAVRAYRGPQVSDETMQGQYFDGAEAVARGLADRVGTIGDAIALAAEMARERMEDKR